jgi:hypothetical protein
MKRLLTAAAAVALMLLAIPVAANAAPNDYPPVSTSGSPGAASNMSPNAQQVLTNLGFQLGSTSSVQTITLPTGRVLTLPVGSGYRFVFPPVFTPGEPVNMTVVNSGPGLRGVHAAFVQAPAAASGATVTASANGSVSLTLTPTKPGTYKFTLTGATSGATTSATIVVKAASSAAAVGNTAGAAAGGLSYTGVNSTMITFGALGGGLALVIGAGLVWLGATRRRGSQQHA